MDKSKTNYNLAGFTGIVLLYIVFGIFTYFPPKTELFLDHVTNCYGISN